MDYKKLAENQELSELEPKRKIFLIDLAQRIDRLIPMMAVSMIYARIGAIPSGRHIGPEERKLMATAVLDAADSNEIPRLKRIFELLDVLRLG